MTVAAQMVRLIEEVSGIVIPEHDLTRLGQMVQARAEANDSTPERYLRQLRLDSAHPEWRTLLSLITVKESFLYRAPQQFRALAEQILPELTAKRVLRTLRAWCAGCARGEEATTLAIVLADSPHMAGWDWRILATDVDEAALDDARRGLYGGRAVATVPAHVLERFFEPRGQRYQLLPALRSRIEYRQLNLIRQPLEVPEAPFDLIFLRNVLIYFRVESQRRVLASVAEMLVPDGRFFVGPSESLAQRCDRLTPIDLGDCFCYRRCTDAERTTVELMPRPRPRSATAVARPERKPNEQAAKVSAPVATPTPAAAKQPAPGEALAPPAPTPETAAIHARIVEALSANRAGEARNLVGEWLPRLPEDAVIRAFMGLVHDVSGENEAAVQAYRAALYLEPRLSQVRYLLARCLERLGWQAPAQRELRQVLGMASGTQLLLPGSDRLGLPSVRQVETACRDALAKSKER